MHPGSKTVSFTKVTEMQMTVNLANESLLSLQLTGHVGASAEEAALTRRPRLKTKSR